MTGITVCPKSSPRVVSSIGTRQVGTKTAAGRGETVSAEICMSATGTFMPPMLIFPRARENPDYLENKPPGAWAVFDKSGWMQCHIFTKWFKKFIEFSRASATNPVLLVLDGHASHVKNLEVIDLARENNVHILCLPPHCSHKIQPLDVGFMKPLSTYYTEALRAFQRAKGTVAMKNIFGIFGSAFLKAARLETAVNSFKKCGIEPCNPGVFTESDFVSNSRSGLNSKKN
uniref:DDE-1 domain-containing protein n=1 Tax=Trichogramma kaykai TaxID=54128 RepID=A0ABD2X603_9HYME